MSEEKLAESAAELVEPPSSPTPAAELEIETAPPAASTPEQISEVPAEAPTEPEATPPSPPPPEKRSTERKIKEPKPVEEHDSVGPAEVDADTHVEPSHDGDHARVRIADTADMEVAADAEKRSPSIPAKGNLKKTSVLDFGFTRLSTVDEVEFDSSSESDDERESYLQQKSLLKMPDFFEILGEVPSLSKISLDSSMIEEDVVVVATREPTIVDPTADVGRFVDPLTGELIVSQEEIVEPEPTEDVEAGEEEEEESETESEDDELLVPEIEDDADLKAVDDEDTFQTFFEMERDTKVQIMEELDMDAIEREFARREVANDTQFFLKHLIDRIVEVAEYVDPKMILRENMDKMKLAFEIVKSLDELERVRRSRTFLNRKTIEYFRRKKSLRALADDNPNTIQADIAKYTQAVESLDHLLGRENETRTKRNDKIHELNIQARDMESKLETDVRMLEDVVRKALCRDTFERLQMVVDVLLNKMGALRKEISNVRSLFIQRQHTYAALISKLQKLEDLGNGLSMRDFEQLRTETQALGKKIEERNTELYKLRTRCNADLHIMAHMREKQQMLRNSITIQEGALNELIDEKNYNRTRLYELKMARTRIRGEIKDLSFQGGLLDKPALMLDYDETVDKLEHAKGRVHQLHMKYAASRMKLNKITLRFKALQMED